MSRLIALSLLVALVFAAPAGTSIPFTVDDMLAVSNISIGALSDDGQWLAATSTSPRDRIGVDNHRFGDPTYIAPVKMDLLVIDTRTGKSQKVFTDRRQVRALS